MNQRLKGLLLTLLIALLLLGFAWAVPSPCVTDEAMDRYTEESVPEDDPYSFL